MFVVEHTFSYSWVLVCNKYRSVIFLPHTRLLGKLHHINFELHSFLGCYETPSLYFSIFILSFKAKTFFEVYQKDVVHIDSKRLLSWIKLGVNIFPDHVVI